jgi:hypothetical protein
MDATIARRPVPLPNVKRCGSVLFGAGLFGLIADLGDGFGGKDFDIHDGAEHLRSCRIVEFVVPRGMFPPMAQIKWLHPAPKALGITSPWRNPFGE